MNKNETILIIDDEERIRSVLSSILSKKGLHAISAENGPGGLEQIRENNISVVLLDLMMPEMNGMQVLEIIKKDYPALPVIMITAYGSVPTAVDAIKQGAYDFVEKPLDADKILVTINNALEKNRLIKENVMLRHSILERYKMVGKSSAMQRIFNQIDVLAPKDCTVLITGATGTGKELVARSLHSLSPRVAGPFVKINCSAIPKELVESELFGHARGAFTGAHQEKKGKFEAADGGTIFLDEIGELASNVQAKLLQVLEEKVICRLGEVTESPVDVRIIAATNKDMQNAIDNGEFRSDLFYRINTTQITIPPLRQRTEDIPELINFFTPLLCEELSIKPKTINPDAIHMFLQQPWTGNVRELKHTLMRLLIYCPDDTLDYGYIFNWLEHNGTERSQNAVPSQQSLNDAREHFEHDYILNALKQHDWNIHATANFLGIERTNLYRKMKGLGIEKE